MRKFKFFNDNNGPAHMEGYEFVGYGPLFYEPVTMNPVRYAIYKHLITGEHRRGEFIEGDDLNIYHPVYNPLQIPTTPVEYDNQQDY